MVSTRYTKILIANTGGLFPAEWIYPADDLFPVEAGVREITNIVAGSLKLDEMIAERTPQFGQLYSSKFECKVYLEDDLSGKNIAVYQENEGVLHGVFFGKIDSCKTDRVGTDRTIVAYDPAYELREINVATWWEQFWSDKETATLKQVRDSLTTYLQISSEDVTLPNDDLVVTKTVSLSTCTFQQMLKMICELNCCFPHVNRNGNLDYIILNTDDTPTDLDGRYEWTNSNFEEYTTTEIDGVQFFDSGNQLKYTVGNSENAYPIAKNIFLYDKPTSVLISVGNTILDYLSELTYNPANIKMIISDMTFRLGDYVTAEGHNFYIFQNSISGQQFIEQTIKAQGDRQLYSGASHMEYGDFILNEKISRVIANVEEFYTEYTNYAQQTTTKINQNADRIEFQAGKLSNYQGSYIPTTSNSPASSWNTDAKKEAHEGEIFYNPTTRKYYKWGKVNNVWTWAETTDINVARNLSSQLSIESGKITIGTGRLEINAENFTLDVDGNMTANSATLKNANIISTTTQGAGIDVNATNGKIIFLYNDNEIATIVAKKVGNYFHLDVTSDDYISVNADKDVNINADRDINLNAGRHIDIKATDNLDLSSGQPMTFISDSYITIQSTTGVINIVAEDNIDLSGDNGASLSSNAQTNISGEYVSINATNGISAISDSMSLYTNDAKVDINSDTVDIYGYNGVNIDCNGRDFNPNGRINASAGITVSYGLDIDCGISWEGYSLSKGTVTDYYGDSINVVCWD